MAGGTVRGERFAVTTTGSAGTATGSATTANAIVGEIMEITLDYHASAPATTDVTIEGATTGVDHYVKANSVTDAFTAPVVYAVDAAGAALTNNVTPWRRAAAEKLTVSLAQSDALTNAVKGTVVYRPLRREQVCVTTTGVDGSAAGNATSGYIKGVIYAIQINYDANVPATNDITIEMAGSGIDLYAASNVDTDTVVHPGLYAVNNANAAVDAGDVGPQRYCISDSVKVSLAQANAITNAVCVDILYDPDVHTTEFRITSAGADGSATGTQTLPVYGELIGLQVNCHANTPSTMDVTVEDTYTGIDIWQRSNSATDAFVVPASEGLSSSGAVLTNNVSATYRALAGPVTVTTAQSNAITNDVTVVLYTRR